ncbi:MAG: 50S ribosomal protein L6 [Mariprofundaceae bacterium]
MSRIGNRPIDVPSGVEVTISATSVLAKGPKGTLTSPLFDGISVSQEGNNLQVQCADVRNPGAKAKFGLVRTLLANSITGVSRGFERVLELRGVGYRVQLQGTKLILSLGFSHPVEYSLPEGIEAKVEQSRIIFSGADKQMVGQVAAEVRAFRSPEPYKGKGVRYEAERVIMKEGKKV